MSPPRHNKDQGLLHYPDGSWGYDAYIDGRRVRKKIGGKEAARDELARLKGQAARRRKLTLTGPDFDAVRYALGTIEDQVAALRDQLAAARSREDAARSALAQLLEAVAYLAEADETMAAASEAAQRVLDRLYADSH